jgi:hypothetical protein
VSVQVKVPLTAQQHGCSGPHIMTVGMPGARGVTGVINGGTFMPVAPAAEADRSKLSRLAAISRCMDPPFSRLRHRLSRFNDLLTL